MSIRHGLLALLDEKPRHGYDLRAEFERRTGSTWPLNVGQVYTTLARLERDGLVEQVADAAVGDGATDRDGHVVYRVTEHGRAEVSEWFTTPVPRTQPPRDELAIKLALALTVPGVDAREVLQRQRTATVRALQAHTRRRTALTAATRGSGPAASSSAAVLVVESLIFSAEAEVRWLDHCEARLLRAASSSNGAHR